MRATNFKMSNWQLYWMQMHDKLINGCLAGHNSRYVDERLHSGEPDFGGFWKRSNCLVRSSCLRCITMQIYYTNATDSILPKHLNDLHFFHFVHHLHHWMLQIERRRMLLLRTRTFTSIIKRIRNGYYEELLLLKKTFPLYRLLAWEIF